jgi:asparagine synthase (glutamine-hydrolysing)
VELSGGMDSANVAVTLAARGDREVLACALIFGGDIGAQQVRRRREMIEYCGFRDLRIDALEYPPLMAHGARAAGEAIDPLAEAFHEAVERMLEQAGARGISTVFTGDGGDELLGLRTAEWKLLDKMPSRFNPSRQLPAWLGPRTIELLEHVESNLAPPSVINPATLLGFASRTPQFMEARMWPLSPLCSPRLIELCEQLPLEWRRGKRLCRERLRRLGFSEDVINPPLRENFRHVMERGLAEFGMPLLMKLLPDSVLVDHGYVDADELRAAHDRVVAGNGMETSIFAFLRTELGVRSMVA